MIVRAAAIDLPRLTGARPAVLVAEGLPDAAALGTDSLDVWVAAVRGAVTLLHPLGQSAPDPETAEDLPTPPVSVIAIVATERVRSAALLGWWSEASGLPAPPLLLATSGATAMPMLLGRLTGVLAEATAREAALDGALTALRLELEETRMAAADMARRLAHLPPCPLRLVLDGEAGDGTAAALQGDPLRLQAEPGVMLAGLAALAVHVASVPSTPGTLRLRLLGGESGRVAGSWLIHHASLAPGWLLLDLPTPLPALRETAIVEITSEGETAPALSLDPRWAGLEGSHPLALRAWSGEPGSRYLLPRFWDPEEVGLSLAAAGVPHSLPPAAWNGAAVLAGDAPLAALGEEEPRPVLRAAAGGHAVILLPHLHAPGMDRLRVLVSPAGPEGGAVAAWVHPVGARLPDVASFDRLDGNSAGTGWRDLVAPGTELVLNLPAASGGRVQLAIGLRAEAHGAATAEVSQVTLEASRAEGAPATARRATLPDPAPPPPIMVSLPRVSAAPSAPAPPPRPVTAAETGAAAPVPASTATGMPTSAPGAYTAAPATRAPIPARHETVRLHQHLPGASYEHLDMTVVGLARGPQRWPSVRVKLAMKDTKPSLEFRKAAGWPASFQDWLGTGSDRFGPFLRITREELPDFLDRITDERDAAMMQGLLTVLPAAAEAAAREASMPTPDVARWVQAARAVQEAGRPASRPVSSPA
ncbi:DUF6212 domain-containing protein [Muricoccus radiodurans]|uniref:DUF6212 domain-containing protein n=1 Tax=Muricoccus radiodurans TaxID=2231721 RepID=UPI003CF0B251